MLSEPYVGSSKEVKSIYGLQVYQFPQDRTVKACIIIVPKLGTKMIGLAQYSTPNMCVVRLDDGNRKILLVSIYVEPNEGVHGTLDRLEHFLKLHPNDHIVVGGDFNGWHPVWGSSRNNNRGDLIIDLMNANNLYLCNTGSTPTFETVTHGRDRSSIIDLTLATGDAHDWVENWRVDVTICPSSQHNAIVFQLENQCQLPDNNSSTSTYRYNSKHANWAAFRDILLTNMASEDIINTDLNIVSMARLEVIIEKVTEVIQHACSESMPVKRAGQKPKPPWWTDRLENLKAEVVSLHRQIHSAKRRGEALGALLAERQLKKTEYAAELKKNRPKVSEISVSCKIKKMSGHSPIGFLKMRRQESRQPQLSWVTAIPEIDKTQQMLY
ncbi:uncharacterized protein LOC131846082 [Achroia grisella]|uniref:uncharacterized protein LOC131846082 n=1 Tax=Achroia grisella TaxID=688607 RepID=UPI0027D2CC4A|nr:uncharacterized protein LOC131846082 [Achroia grisella]